MAKAKRLGVPLTEAQKKTRARRQAKAKAEAKAHEMAEPAKKQPTGRGRPKRKPKAVGQTKAHDAVASKAEKERIEKANKANAKLESKKPVVGNKGKVKPRPSKIAQDTREARARQRILNENMLTTEERKRREKIAEEKRAKEARAAQEKKDFPNKRRTVVEGKARARAALRNAGTIKTNDPKGRFKNSKNKVQARQVNPPRTNDQTPEAKKAARKGMLKKAGSVVKGVAKGAAKSLLNIPTSLGIAGHQLNKQTISKQNALVKAGKGKIVYNRGTAARGTSGRTFVPFTKKELAERAANKTKGQLAVKRDKERKSENRDNYITKDPNKKLVNARRAKVKPKAATKPEPKPKVKPKPKPINPKYKKSKFGVGDSKTVEHKGKKLANVTKEQLKSSGLSLRQYMNKWNKTGKRP